MGVLDNILSVRSGVKKGANASVMMVPGSMALTRMAGPKSWAKLRVIWLSAALAAP